MRRPTTIYILACVVSVLVGQVVRADNAGFALAPKSSTIAIDARGLTDILDRENAASVRPLLEAVAGREAIATFDALARRCNTGTDTVAREVFSGRVAFALTETDVGIGWIFGIEADDARCERMLKLLGAKMRAPGRFDAIAERLTIRRVGGWLLIAPLPMGEAMLEEASARIAVEDPTVSLLGEPLVQQLLGSDASVRIFVRHDHPIGGATSIGLRTCARSGGRGLRAEICGVYESAPIGRPGEATALDPRVVGAFEDRAVMVVANPCSGVPTTSDAFWLALLPELAPSPAMRANLSGERVMAFGSCRAHPMPSLAVAWRVEDAEQARNDQDLLMRSVCCGLTRANETSNVSAPSRAEGRPESNAVPVLASDLNAASETDVIATRRSRALGPFLDRYLGKPFKLGASEVCWDTVPTPCGGWQVYASDPEWLSDVVARLKVASCLDGPRPRMGGIGFCDGPRAAALLRRWKPLVAEPQNAMKEDRVARGIGALAETIERLGRLRFEYESPGIGRLNATVDIEPLGSLPAQPDSGRPRPEAR